MGSTCPSCPLQLGGAGMVTAIRGHRLLTDNWEEGRGKKLPSPPRQSPWDGFHLTARREGAGAARSGRTSPASGQFSALC